MPRCPGRLNFDCSVPGRHAQHRHRATPVALCQRHVGPCPVACGKLPAHVGQPDTAAAGCDPRQADAVVGHAQVQVVAVPLRLHDDAPRTRRGADTVLDGVLHQCQQDQRRKRPLQRRGIGLDGPGQPGVHAQGRQFEVGPRQLQFVAQRDVYPAHARQRGAQVAQQAGHEGFASRSIAAVQRARIGQSVEQEVRFDLRLQQRQALGGLFALEVGLAELQPRSFRAACVDLLLAQVDEPNGQPDHGPSQRHQHGLGRQGRDPCVDVGTNQDGCSERGGQDRQRRQQPAQGRACRQGCLRHAVGECHQCAGDERCATPAAIPGRSRSRSEAKVEGLCQELHRVEQRDHARRRSTHG